MRVKRFSVLLVLGLLLVALTSSAMMPVAHAQSAKPEGAAWTGWLNITQATAIERAQRAIEAGGLRVLDTKGWYVHGEDDTFVVSIKCIADDETPNLISSRATRVLVSVDVTCPRGNVRLGSLRDFLGEYMRRGQNPTGTGGGGNPPAGSRDILGKWEQTTPGIGTSTWTITRREDGTFGAEETPLGNAKGTAKLTGDRLQILRIDFKWSGGEGYYEWDLDDEGRGRLVHTRPRSGTFPNSRVTKRQQELAGDWRDNGDNEYRITKQGDKYSGTYLKVNDSLKSFGFTVGEETFRNFTPVPGKANTFEGEVKWRHQNGNYFWQKGVITLNDSNNLIFTGVSYPQWVRIRR